MWFFWLGMWLLWEFWPRLPGAQKQPLHFEKKIPLSIKVYLFSTQTFYVEIFQNKDKSPVETEDSKKPITTEETQNLRFEINRLEIESQEQFYLIRFFRGLMFTIPLSMLCWWLIWVLFFWKKSINLCSFHFKSNHSVKPFTRHSLITRIGWSSIRYW